MKTILPTWDDHEPWLSNPYPDHSSASDDAPYLCALKLVVWLIGEEATQTTLETVWNEREKRIQAGAIDRYDWRVRTVGWHNADEGTLAYEGVWAGLHRVAGTTHIALLDAGDPTLTFVPLQAINIVALYANPSGD